MQYRLHPESKRVTKQSSLKSFATILNLRRLLDSSREQPKAEGESKVIMGRGILALDARVKQEVEDELSASTAKFVDLSTVKDKLERDKSMAHGSDEKASPMSMFGGM